MPSTQDAKLYLGDTLICSPGGSGPWVRPADWLALPEVGETEQKFVGLYAVTNDDSNILALSAEGAYTVDWGDGSSPENFASGVQAKHAYDYSAISGDTLSSRGYKQVIVTLTPQAENNLTQLKLQERPSEYGAQRRNHAWLDITVGSPELTTFLLANTASPANYILVIKTDWLEQVTIRSHAMTLMDGMFSECHSLQSVPLFNTSSVTLMEAMFRSCYALQSVPLFDTFSVTAMGTMFSDCYALQSVPLFNTSSVTNMSETFSYCYSLQSVPLFDTSGVTNMSGMFYQ
jgi:surface protein